MTTIYVSARRPEVQRVIASLIPLLSGRQPDPTGGVQRLQLLAGMVALSLIKDAYVIKARGGMDAAGDKWAPLSEETLARRRQRITKKKKGRKGQEEPKDEILRDTGILLNSLSPGVDPPFQVLRTEPGVVIVGTNVTCAKYHHSDKPRKMKKDGTPKLPQRRLWPTVDKWPSKWTGLIVKKVREGTLFLLKEWLQRL